MNELHEIIMNIIKMYELSVERDDGGVVTTRLTQKQSISGGDATSAHFRTRDIGGDTTVESQKQYAVIGGNYNRNSKCL